MKVLKEWKNKSGVYIIKSNDREYIGSAINLYERLSVHFSQLRGNYHHSKFMQNHFNKYGEDTFTVEILEYCEKNIIILREKELYYILKHKSCFNSTTPITFEHSLDMKIRISNTLKEKFKNKLLHPRYNKGIKYNIYDVYGDIIKKEIGIAEATLFLKLSNPSVIRNLLKLKTPIIHQKYIIILSNVNYLDFIYDCIKHKKGIMTIYQIFQDNSIKRCTASQNQKLRHKVFESKNYIYTSKTNKCNYTYIGLLKYLPKADEMKETDYQKIIN
jgi:group I intron endonuclease